MGQLDFPFRNNGFFSLIGGGGYYLITIVQYERLYFELFGELNFSKPQTSSIIFKK